MQGLEKTAKVISALGAIVLGLSPWVSVLGSLSGVVGNIVYAIIGLSGIWALVKVFK